MIREFEIRTQAIDVTGLDEQNPDWFYPCECGSLISCANMPRRKFVKWEYIDEGERAPVMSYHCKHCWAQVPDDEMKKSIRASTWRVYQAGVAAYYIDGQEVAAAEYERQLTTEIAKARGE